jgi:hypothetical protein
MRLCLILTMSHSVKPTHPMIPMHREILRFSIQALLAIGVVVAFVLLLHLT